MHARVCLYLHPKQALQGDNVHHACSAERLSGTLHLLYARTEGTEPAGVLRVHACMQSGQQG